MFEATLKIRQLIEAASEFDSKFAVREIADMVTTADLPDDERDRLQRIGLEFDIKRELSKAKKKIDASVPYEIQPALEGIPMLVALNEKVGAEWVYTSKATRDEYITALQFLDEKAVQTASKAEAMRQLWKTIDYVWAARPDWTLQEVLLEHAKREDAARPGRFISPRRPSDGLSDSPLA